MDRSVYSLVLMEDVIRQIDELAYTMHTSRSNLINQILAERVQMVTPEMRVQDIFEYLSQSMQRHKGFQLQAQTSQAVFSVKSPLQYRYRPVVRYCVELYREPRDTVGELRVTVRTQSQQLLQDWQTFGRLWAQLEDRYAAPAPQKQMRTQVEPGKLARKLAAPAVKEGNGHEALAHNIENYLTMFDDILKQYFARVEDPPAAQRAAQARYLQYVENGLPRI